MGCGDLSICRCLFAETRRDLGNSRCVLRGSFIQGTAPRLTKRNLSGAVFQKSNQRRTGTGNLRLNIHPFLTNSMILPDWGQA